MHLSLTEKTQRIISRDARLMAIKLKNPTVESEHILLSLLRDQENSAYTVLQRVIDDLDVLIGEIDYLDRKRRTIPEDIDPAEVRFAISGTRVVESAREEAQVMGHSYVGPEHLLLGLVREGEGIAYRVLSKRGLTLNRIRKEVWMVINNPLPELQQSGEKNYAKETDNIMSEEHLVFHDHPDIEKIILNEKQIAKRVRDIAATISRDYAGKEPQLISVLKGSLFFLSDLLRQLTIPCRFDLMTVSSYGDKTVSSGQVKLVMDLKQDIKGKDVIIVEDIYDSGRTLQYITNHIKSREPASLKTAVLLNKKATRSNDVGLLDYVGFDIPDEFVVGYGLDYGERYRQLPYIGVLKPHVYSGKNSESK